MRTFFLLTVFVCIIAMSLPALADFSISQSSNGDSEPAIAYNSSDNRYLVVWNELIPLGQVYMIGPVMGQLITEGGALVGSAFQIFSNGVGPSVAYNSQTNEYLVTTTWTGIKGQRVNSVGTLVGTAVQLLDNASNSRIVYNSVAGNYLLAAVEFTENPAGSGYYDMKILTRKIAADGSPLGTAQVADSYTYQPGEARYAIAYAPLQSPETPQGRYLLAAQTNIGVSLTMLNSEGERMFIVHDPQSGMDYQYIPFSTGTVTGGEYHVDVAYGTQSGYSMSGPAFLVVWGDNNNTWQGQDWTGIWGGFVDAQKLSYLTTDPVPDNAFPISAIYKHWAYSSYAETWKPVAAFNPLAEKFLVAWRETPGTEPENDTKVNHIRANRAFVQVPPPTNVVLSATTGSEDPQNPAIAASTYSSNALVVWMDHRNAATTDWDIYGSLYTVTPTGSITVISPNGGETWVINTQQEIKWSSTNFTDPVKILLSYDGYSPQFWQTIAPSTPNDGSYLWTVPSNTSANCVIRIEDAADGDPYDMSDAPFSIVVPFGANTFPGTNVQVDLGSGVSTTFDNVTTAGTTSLTTSQTGSPPPGGFTIIPSGSPTYYSITTTATFTGNIKVCIQYNDAGLTPTQEAALTLQVYESGQWQDVTSSLDVNANIICATVTHLSDFAMMFPSTMPAYIEVTNTDDSGPGSLREALNLAASNPGPDSVRFNIPTTDPGYNPATGVWTIQPATTYYVPAGTTVDGRIALAGGGSRPGIEIDGTTLAQSSMTGLWLYEGATLRGLVVNSCQYGIWIASANVTVGDCYVGTDPPGTSVKPNGADGILLANGATGAIIQDNLLSGNNGSGIRLFGEATANNTLRNNRIGTNAAGTAALPNAFDGITIHVNAHDNIIEHNLVSGNAWNGIQLFGAATRGNVLRNNFIGTDISGTAVLANGSHGIPVHAGAHNNLIEQNLVSGNTGIGIYLFDAGTEGNVVKNNLVGTDVSGTAALANGSFGVALFDGPQNNMVGPDNLVAFNSLDGVLVDGADSFTSTVSNTITRNSIFANGREGIWNFRGGNTELTPPTLLLATPTQVTGTTGPGHTVEVFADEADEGRFYLGSTVADGSGNFVLMLSAPPPLPSITATCTDAAGNTSEFSQATPVVPVELMSFEATVTEASVLLAWSTASETNNFGFEIERSRDKTSFAKIGFVAGHETTATPRSYTFTDRDLPVGRYYYRLKQIDTGGSFKHSPIIEATIEPPKSFELSQNYPNPFNAETAIRYQVFQRTRVVLQIFDLTGKEVTTLVDKEQSPGYYSLHWAGTDRTGRAVASGVYLCTMRTKEFTTSRKIALVR